MLKVLNKRIISFLLVAIFLIQVSIPVDAANNTNDISELSEEEVELLENEIPNLDINNMSVSEKTNFNMVIDEEVEKEYEYQMSIGNNNFNKEKFKQELIKLFSTNKMSLYSIRVPISNRLVAKGIDVAIGIVVSSGVSGVKAFISKKGAAAARKIFTVTIKDRLIAWGATKVGSALGPLVSIIMSYIDFGTRCANWLDRNDRNGKNGYWDIYIL